MSEFAIHHETMSGIEFIKPHDDINLYSIPDLKKLMESLEKTSKRKYIFDFANINFIDSSGIGYFIRLILALKKAKLKVKFININSRVLHVFQVSGISEQFYFFSNLNDAMEDSWEHL